MAGEWSVGSATVDLIADLTKLKSGLDSAEQMTQKSGSTIGKVFGTAFSFATGTLIADGIKKLGGSLTSFLGDAISESRDAAKGLAQTEAVLRSTGNAAGVTAQQIVDLAGSLSKLTLFSDDDIQSTENLIATFTDIKNVAGDGNDIFTQTTKIALDMAQALGTDAKGSAIALGKSLQNPIKGVAALTRVGVTFTKEQIAQIKTLQESGKTMEAQKIILAELTKEFGGSAEAAAKADGGWHLFQQRLADVEQTIGDALMPALTTAMTWLTGPGLDAVEKFGTGIAHWITDTGIPNLKRGLQTIQDTIAGFKTGDFSIVKMDLTTWFGEGGATTITTALQDISKAWGLARDSVVTFKEAWDGNWKDADTILPLHRAIGNLGVVAHMVFEWLNTRGIPGLKIAVEESFPSVKSDLDTFATWFHATFFKTLHDDTVGLTGDMREHRDGAVSGWADILAAAQKSWEDQKVAGEAHQARLTAWKDYFLQTWAPGIDSGFDDVKNTALDVLTVQLPLYWGTAKNDALTAAAQIGNSITQIENAFIRWKAAMIDAFNTFTDLVHQVSGITLPKIQTPQAPGTGGGSGDSSNFGGSPPPVQPPGRRGPNSLGGGTGVNVYNFYTSDNNLALRYLRQSGA